MVAVRGPHPASVRASQLHDIMANGIGRNGGGAARSHTEHQGTELLKQPTHRNFPGTRPQLTYNLSFKGSTPNIATQTLTPNTRPSKNTFKP